MKVKNNIVFQINLSTYAFLFSEIVQYSHSRVTSLSQLHEKYVGGLIVSCCRLSYLFIFFTFGFIKSVQHTQPHTIMHIHNIIVLYRVVDMLVDLKYLALQKVSFNFPR